MGKIQRVPKAVMLRITPELREALATLSSESGLTQADLADRMLMPLLALTQRYGWYVVLELLREAAIAAAHRPKKPRRHAPGLRRPNADDIVRTFLEMLD